MQGMNLRDIQNSPAIKLVCVVAFLWLNLSPALHQIAHLWEDYTHAGCQHHEHETDNPSQTTTEMKAVTSDCQLCHFTAYHQPLGLNQAGLNAVTQALELPLTFDRVQQSHKQECHSGYHARAGPITS